MCCLPVIASILGVAVQSWKTCRTKTERERNPAQKVSRPTNEQRDNEMRIDKIRAIAGPNIYTHKPVLVARLFLEELTEKSSAEIPGFVDRLIATLPGLNEHRCSRERTGGFLERLREGTYFAHIVEHIALELTEHAGIPSYFGRARYGGAEGCYNVVIECKAEQGARFLLDVAV